MSRLTLAEPYDLGRMGRYARYVLAIPLILEHPFGLGMLQIDKIFPEPIHNIFISSFVNYGWLAGVAWIMLTILSVKVDVSELRRDQEPDRRVAGIFAGRPIAVRAAAAGRALAASVDVLRPGVGLQYRQLRAPAGAGASGMAGPAAAGLGRAAGAARISGAAGARGTALVSDFW